MPGYYIQTKEGSMLGNKIEKSPLNSVDKCWFDLPGVRGQSPEWPLQSQPYFRVQRVRLAQTSGEICGLLSATVLLPLSKELVEWWASDSGLASWHNPITGHHDGFVEGLRLTVVHLECLWRCRPGDAGSHLLPHGAWEWRHKEQHAMAGSQLNHILLASESCWVWKSSEGYSSCKTIHFLFLLLLQRES